MSFVNVAERTSSSLMTQETSRTNDPVPVWLLDVDGVVNAHTNSPQRLLSAWPKEAWVDTEADGGRKVWQIQAATPVVDFIRKVHDSGLAEIRWHTTWQEHALNVGRAIGLPDFPIHDAPEYDPGFWHRVRGTDSWWKLPSVTRLVHLEKRALIWTDDDIDYEMTKQQRRSLQEDNRVLLIAPDAYVGLCQVHLDKIDKFLSPGDEEEPQK